MVGAIEEGELRIDGVRVFYRRVAGEGTPTVYCHGNPTHGEDWLPFLERGGPAVAIDMPGWGRSDKPDPRHFDYSMFGLSAFLERCFEELGVAQRKLGGDRGPMPAEFIDMTWSCWDKGTRDATLALYRHADPDRLARAGRDLGRLSAPALVIWGDRDPYLPIRFAEAYADALPDSRLQMVAGGGHWPWIDRPALIEDVLAFLA